ncbi:MAG: AAA family ATPase [Rhodospirillales bacterium]|nr:AAA family ATPase [Rhodospirillales bacterium]
MAARAYRQLKIDEIEQLLKRSTPDQAMLQAVFEELGCRSTAKARELKRRVEALLKVEPAATKKSVAEAKTHVSQPREQEPNQAPGDLPAGWPTRSPAEPAAKISLDGVTARPRQQQPLRAESPSPQQPTEPRPRPMPETPKRELTPEQARVTQVIDYVCTLVELGDKPVWSLASYKNLLLHEAELRNRIGIRHDLSDEDGPVYLKVDRLQRIDPPEPPPAARDWITVGREPTKEPVVQTLRTAVMNVTEVARLVQEGKVDPIDVTNTLKPKPGEDLKDVILRLDRFSEAKEAIEAYVGEAWRDWAQAEAPRRETIAIYDGLFSLQQALRFEGAEKPLEVVWGMGVGRWKLPPNELDHPLVEQLVELELDGASAILVRPRGVEPIVALKPFVSTENPGADMVMRFAREHFAKLGLDRELSPFDKDTFSPVLRYACGHLDRGGQYHPDSAASDDRTVPEAGPTLVITDTWAIYARPRSENFFTLDLERLRTAVEEADQLPGPAAGLVTVPTDEPTYTPSIPGLGGIFGSGAAGGAAAATAQQALGRRFYFPKPFNEEQMAIVERLEDPEVDGVVVQGPPGTGKTHTIANIICHYLATGRRVLVTSKSEGALAVLRDQIPAGIRDLAISLLTSERQGLKQLEATVNLLASQIASLDARPMERDVVAGEQRIEELGRRITEIDAEMRSFAEKHLRRLGGEKGTDGVLPMELAERIVRERDRFAWFPDSSDAIAGKRPEFAAEDIAAIRSARKAVGADLKYLDARLPSISDLPDIATVSAIHGDLANAAKIERARDSDAPVMSSAEPNAVARVEALLGAIDAIVGVHRICLDHPWSTRLYFEWQRQGLDAQAILPVAQLFASMGAHIERRRVLLTYAVAVTDDTHTNDDLVAAIDRAANGRKPFGLMPIGKAIARKLFAEIRILGRAPAGTEDWGRISEYVAWKRQIAAEVARWRALALDFELPELSEDVDEAARSIQSTLERVSAIAEAVQRHVPLVAKEASSLFLRGPNPTAIVATYQGAERAAASIRLELARYRLASARESLAQAVGKLASCSGPVVQRLSDFLKTVVGNPDVPDAKVGGEWSALVAELARIRGLFPQLATVDRVASLVAASGAAKWAERLRRDSVTGVEDPWTPDHWRDAWNRALAEGHLRAIDGRARLQELDQRRRDADDEMRRQFHEVVRMRTLLTLKARITNRVDAALQMFLTAIRRIGKGTGKSASRLRRDARDAMEVSFAAIPCWIMPSWRVSESLPATPGSFDLVIFDEASQSDISAVPALLRASKVLIVGDDKQVSPTAAFIEEQRIRSLRMHYLDGQPFGALMLPGNSLYELALACYPGRRIMLREHFRCVEPIIGFSLQFYTDLIVPVRVPKASERLSPPLIDVLVPHGRKDRSNCNHAEAEAIVDEIAHIVADPSFANRTIGVISLIGSNQAQLIQGMLLERIGEDAYIRHDIACGDSAVFQGKERDIVLLSMVECPETRTSKTALPFQQRFNVALSRARDREYVFHSVTEEMLKPDDLKAKVLRHFRNPMAGRTASADDPMALCQSGFERDVLGRLLTLGYRVRPQVKVGPYSIDLVVEGQDDRRLAVELDGDQYHGPDRWAEDLSRQRVMERVGWRFWRCWGSSYRLDAEGCIDELVRALSSMNIEPIGTGAAETVWTEFRTIAPAAGDEDGTPTSAATPSVNDLEERQAPRQREGAELVVEVGDRVQVQIGDESRVRVILLTADRHDPDLGVVSVKHPAGAALLGAREEEEIEFSVGDRTMHWMVIRIERER